MKAVKLGDLELVQALTQQEQACLDMQDHKGRTALMIAVAEEDIEIVQCLVDQGVDMDRQDKRGWTALFIAVGQGNVYLVHLLVEAGADIDKRDEKGRNALRIAVEAENEEMVDWLLEEGEADVDLPDFEGQTALMWATRQ
eukprot:g10560.t1